MQYTDNPVADYETYSAEQEKELDKLPKCSHCGEPIQDEFCWEIDGEIYHPDCAELLFCHCTDNYIGQ